MAIWGVNSLCAMATWGIHSLCAMATWGIHSLCAMATWGIVCVPWLPGEYTVCVPMATWGIQSQCANGYLWNTESVCQWLPGEYRVSVPMATWRVYSLYTMATLVELPVIPSLCHVLLLFSPRTFQPP